jgi:hypothetical protein
MNLAEKINVGLLILSTITTLATIWLSIKTYRFYQQKDINERELEALRKRIENFKEAAKSYTWTGDALPLNVFVLGPRASGKSSIAQLWQKPWTDIHTISATAKWEEHIIKINEVKKILKKKHPRFDVECDFSSILQIRIRDYAGEDRNRLLAMEDLDKLEHKAVIMFVMKVGFTSNSISFADDNSAYFSSAFVEMIHKSLTGIYDNVLKVIVVFNKVDVLPKIWGDERMLEELKKANADAISQIERVFSPLVEYKSTSALTNFGMIDLLGAVAKAFLGKDVSNSTLDMIRDRMKKHRS